MLEPDVLRQADWVGEKVVERSGRLTVLPVLGAKELASLFVDRVRVSDVQLDAMFRGAVVPKAAYEYFKSRRMLVEVGDFENRKLAVVPRTRDYGNAPLQEYSDDALYRSGEVIDAARKKLTLSQMFDDPQVRDKLGLSDRRLVAAQRQALSDARGAAASLQTYLRTHGFPAYTVAAGDMQKNHKTAAAFIRESAKHYRDIDPVVDARMVRNDIWLFANDMGRSKDYEWVVKGPVMWAVEVRAIHKMALVVGPYVTMGMFSWETAVLGICIFDREDKPYCGDLTGYADPAGIVPLPRAARLFLSSAEQAQRVCAASVNVLPVRAGGKVVGSAVRVSDRYAIFNDHTWAACQDGEVGEVQPVWVGDDQVVNPRLIGSDVVLVHVAHTDTHWPLRMPRLNERVVLVYSVGETVEYTEALSVVGASGTQMTVSYSEVMRPGMSGAAVVAVSDGAMLGIFCTVDSRRAICELFTPASFAKAVELDSQSPLEDTAADEEEYSAFTCMTGRGLKGTYHAVRSSITPLVSNGSFVGSALCLPHGKLVTTVDVDQYAVGPPGSAVLAFEQQGSCYVAPAGGSVVSSVPHVRLAKHGERVFAMTRTVDGATALSAMRNVVHVDSRGQFKVDAFGAGAVLLDGATVVATSDGAVVGLYVGSGRDVRQAVVSLCVPLYTLASAGPDGCDGVAAELNGLIGTRSPRFRELAVLGHSTVRAAVVRAATDEGIPTDTALSYLESQWTCGLASRFADGQGLLLSDFRDCDASVWPDVVYVWIGMVVAKGADVHRMVVTGFDDVFCGMRDHEPDKSTVTHRVSMLEHRLWQLTGRSPTPTSFADSA